MINRRGLLTGLISAVAAHAIARAAPLMSSTAAFIEPISKYKAGDWVQIAGIDIQSNKYKRIHRITSVCYEHKTIKLDDDGIIHLV